MERIQAGDRRAFRALLQKFWAPLVVYSTGILGREDAAEDAVQETFIRVWERRHDWSGAGSVSAYLYRITRNVALNARRDREAEMRRRERGAEQSVGPRAVDDPESVMDARSLRAEVDEAIQSLPARRREVFTLSRFHGLTYRQIAEAMEIAPQTVANQMKAALDELKKRLSHHLDAD